MTKQIVKISDAAAFRAEDLGQAEVNFGLLDLLDPRDPDEARLRDRIYWNLPAGDRNNQRTGPNRLEEVNIALQRLVQQHLADRAPLRVLDACCSDAITSVDLFRTLSENALVMMLASDLHTSIKVTTTALGDAVFRDDGKCIQVKLGGQFWTAHFSKKNSLRQEVRRVLLALTGGALVNLPFLSRAERTISLFHPDALALSSQSIGFRLGQHNLFTPMTAEFDLIRIMNVFHSWPTAEVLRAVRTVSASLGEGGIICIGYGTPIGTWSGGKGSHVSIYRRKADRLVPLVDMDTPIREKADIANLRLVPRA